MQSASFLRKNLSPLSKEECLLIGINNQNANNWQQIYLLIYVPTLDVILQQNTT